MITPFMFCLAITALNMPNHELACEQSAVILEEADKNNVKPEILFSLIFYESRWSPKVRSKAGACGLTQVLPRYTKGTLGKHYSCKALHDPETSIQVGAKILGLLHENSSGNIKSTLCKYNRGPYSSSCKSWRAKQRGIGYARKILKFSKAIKKKAEEYHECMTMEEECCVDPHSNPKLFKH